MRTEDRVRLRHMIEAAESAAQFIAGRSRSEDPRTPSMTPSRASKSALAGGWGAALISFLGSRARTGPETCAVSHAAAAHR